MDVRATNSSRALKRRRLGVCLGPEGEVYVGDAESKPPRVLVLTKEAFTQAVRARRIVARCWSVAMPRRECLFKSISLPAGSVEEARQMLAFEVPGLVPMQVGEVCYDALPPSDEQDGYRRVTVVIAPQARVEAASAPLRDAGVLPDMVMPSSLALMRWSRRRDESLSGDGTSMLFFVDARQCQVVVCAQGRLLTARESVVPSDGEMDFAVLLTDALRSLDRIEKPLGLEEVQRVRFVGREDLAERLAEQFRGVRAASDGDQPTCEVLSSEIELSPVTGLPDTVGLSQVAALSALGAGLAEAPQDATALNLVPEVWHENRRRRRRWMERGVTVSMVLVAVAMLCAYLSVRNYRMEAQLRAIAREIEPIRDVATELEMKKQQARVIQSQLYRRSLPLEILSELHRCLPAGAHVSQLTMDLVPGRCAVRMRGPADDLGLAFALPAVLERSELFREARPDGAQQISRGSGTLTEYGCHWLVDEAAAWEGGG